MKTINKQSENMGGVIRLWAIPAADYSLSGETLTFTTQDNLVEIYTAIEKFQSRFYMEEEYWPFESIKKDFFRFKLTHDIDFNQFAFQHLERLILCNMSNVGAVTSSVLQQHELRMVSSG